jgi:hypothetical protein
MSCKALTIAATNKRKVRISIRRVSYRRPGLILALAFTTGVLLSAAPFTSHANHDPSILVTSP